VFLAVKEAFEQIKVMRGLSVKKDLFTSNGSSKSDDIFKSARPHADQYSENFDKFDKTWEGQDRTEFFSKINKERYEHIRKSFENIEEIKELKFNVLDVELPDTDKRWQFEKEKTKNKIFSESSNLAFFIIGSVICFMMILRFVNKHPRFFWTFG
jgi:hypothetical protein